MAALFKGDTSSAEERAAVVKNVARLTGLPPQFVEESNLRDLDAAVRQGTAARRAENRGPLRWPAGRRGYGRRRRHAGI